MRKYNVLQIAPKLDLGGTEKTLQLFSQQLNKDLFNVIVCGWVEGGIRAEQLKIEGFKVYCTNNDKQKLIKVMKGERINIVHVHRSGFGDNFVIEAAYEAMVPVIIETNVFGRIDETSWGKYIDCHIFISKMCALRYKHWLGIPWKSFSQRHRVLYYPVNLAEIDENRLSSERIAQLKRQYGIPLDAPVIGRIGRPDLAKWPAPYSIKSILCELIKLVPNVKVVLMGAPKKILESLSESFELANTIVLLDPSPRTDKVIEFYCLIDVLMHSAKIGESFGLVIAEAMALGKPVVTKSTPLHDNAQVELVDHGNNGYIAYNEKAFAEAITDLLLNDNKRQEMGQRARKKVKNYYDVCNVTKQLESLYLEFLQKKGIQVDLSILEDYQQFTLASLPDKMMRFEEEYETRVRTCWGNPNWVEIFGYEYLFRYHFPNKLVRKMKKMLRY